MNIVPYRRVAMALALASALPVFAAEANCDLQELNGLDTPPERLIACAVGVAAKPAPADAVSNELLYAALDALVNASFTRPSAQAPAAARLLVTEIAKRNALRPVDHPRLRKVLLLNGRLDEAAIDRAAWPAAGEQPLPVQTPLGRPIVPGEARYWRWDAHANAIREQAVDLEHGTHLVVDASPGCQFCAKAVAAIDADPALGQLFQGALWISRPEQELAPDYWHHWNDLHPAHVMVLVLDAQGWELSPQWSTPRFRFFRDGQVVASMLGWTDKSRAALLQAGREQGLLAQ